jgi:hypothetical protein
MAITDMRFGTMPKSSLKWPSSGACLETTLSTTIGPPPHGFKMMTITVIMKHVALKFATVDWISLNKMDE